MVSTLAEFLADEDIPREIRALVKDRMDPDVPFAPDSPFVPEKKERVPAVSRGEGGQ